jgi:hypothetical protein
LDALNARLPLAISEVVLSDVVNDVLEFRADLLVGLCWVQVHAQKDVGLDEVFVLLADLRAECAWLLLGMSVGHLILLVVFLLFPAGVDDGFQQTHCSEADLFRLEGLAGGASDLADRLWALDDLHETLEASILFLSLN